MTFRYSSLEHLVVAQLEGLDVHTQSSLGIVMAVSQDSRRIALATWDRILVYALDPRAFLERTPGLPLAGGFKADNAYLERCGHDYYHKSSEYENIVGLRPVELPKAGVVFSMAFRGQNELWGLTDQGLVKWRFGARCDGRREEVPLPLPSLFGKKNRDGPGHRWLMLASGCSLWGRGAVEDARQKIRATVTLPRQPKEGMLE